MSLASMLLPTVLFSSMFVMLNVTHQEKKANSSAGNRRGVNWLI